MGRRPALAKVPLKQNEKLVLVLVVVVALAAVVLVYLNIRSGFG
jgi:hypothetical protein